MEGNSDKIIKRIIDLAKENYVRGEKEPHIILSEKGIIDEEITLAKRRKDELNITPPEDNYFRFIEKIDDLSYLNFYRLKN